MKAQKQVLHAGGMTKVLRDIRNTRFSETIFIFKLLVDTLTFKPRRDAHRGWRLRTPAVRVPAASLWRQSLF